MLIFFFFLISNSYLKEAFLQLKSISPFLYIFLNTFLPHFIIFDVWNDVPLAEKQ